MTEKATPKKKDPKPEATPSTPVRPATDIDSLLKQLNLSDDEMIFPNHTYTWHEAVSSEDVDRQMNVRLQRVSLDVLLPGPTDMDQITLKIQPDQKSLKIVYKLPKVFLSSRRTAARVGDIAGVPQNQIPNAATRLAGMHRVQAHESQLIPIRKELKDGLEIVIKLPLLVDKQFCKRDDFGVFNPAIQAVSIGIYSHDNAAMVAHRQHVWILHIEMSAAAREETDMNSPGGFKMFTGL